MTNFFKEKSTQSGKQVEVEKQQSCENRTVKLSKGEREKQRREVTHQLAEICTAMDTSVLMRGSLWSHTGLDQRALVDRLLIFSPVNINQGGNFSGTTDNSLCLQEIHRTMEE